LNLFFGRLKLFSKLIKGLLKIGLCWIDLQTKTGIVTWILKLFAKLIKGSLKICLCWIDLQTKTENVTWILKLFAKLIKGSLKICLCWIDLQTKTGNVTWILQLFSKLLNLINFAREETESLMEMIEVKDPRRRVSERFESRTILGNSALFFFFFYR
jgi:hypothetical protein